MSKGSISDPESRRPSESQDAAQVVRGSESAELIERAASHAACSALIPGAGQLLQGRLGAAVVQFGTVAAYATVAIGAGNERLLWVAIAWNVWSGVDAYRRERD